MSRFFSEKYSKLTPYTPGEQPQNMKYVKLNTNESPFPPSKKAMDYAAEHLRSLNLYSDPDSKEISKCLAEHYEVPLDQVLVTNGSDEALNFAFMAFCDEKSPAVFANITYGFYKVFAELNNVPYEEVPLKEDFSIDINDYMGINKTIFIANPNAPTGKLLPVAEIEKVVASNPNNVVIIDEAYIDFGGESVVKLVDKYENLLVIQTFSKSRSLAGGRLGFAIGSKKVIADLNTIKYSTNPYNVNSLTSAVACGVMKDHDYVDECCKAIAKNREFTVAELRKRGFEVLDSFANFVFAKTDKMDGGELYKALKEKGVLVRHFDKKEICQFNRITIGTLEQMQVLLDTLDEILEV